MQHLLTTLPPTLLYLLLSSLATSTNAQDTEDMSTLADINNIPTCANDCALSFLTTQNCPLSTPSCICAYLSYYSACTSSNCTGTDSIKAVASPIPFYIPSLTISIESAAETSCAANVPANPVFTTGVETAVTTGVTSSEAKKKTSLTTSSIEGEQTTAGERTSAGSGEGMTIDTSATPTPTSSPRTSVSSSSASQTSPSSTAATQISFLSQTSAQHAAASSSSRITGISTSSTEKSSSETTQSLSTSTERSTTSVVIATATTSGGAVKVSNTANAAERLSVRNGGWIAVGYGALFALGAFVV